MNSNINLGAQASSLHETSKCRLEACAPKRGFAGWRSRGYLPHFDSPELVQMITFRLDDSVPQEKINAWRSDPRCQTETSFQNAVQNFLDKSYGACWLRRPDIALMVQNALLHFDAERYRLLSWSIMPNHVHTLAEFNHGFTLERVLHSWKSFTANESHKMLKRSGTFWQVEYFDRYIRNEEHFNRALHYIEQNPVKAGLVAHVSQWPFGSAGFQPAF